MSQGEESFPGTARRFESVGFSEIVRVRNRVMELLAAGRKVWRFEGGEPWMPTPDPVKAAMGTALERGHTRYAPSSGIPELRRAILEKVRSKNGIPCDDEAPIVVNGGMQGLFAAFSTLLDAGDEVLLFSPYWTPIVDLIGYHRATPALVPTVEARRAGTCGSARRENHREDEASLLELPEQPDGRRLLAGRNRGGRRLRARARPRGHLRRGLRGPRLRRRAERRDGVASRHERTDDHLLHAFQELLDDGLASRLRHPAEAIPGADPDGRPLHDQRRVHADAVGRRGGARPRHRVRRRVESGLSLPARRDSLRA